MTFTEFTETGQATTPHLLLVGNPVGHSLSPLMHNTAAVHYGLDLHYHAVSLAEEELGAFLAHLSRDTFRGGNVTIPWKRRIAGSVDHLEESATAVGAVNTLVRQGERVVGHNTDSYGFSRPLQEEELEGSRAIVFGTGGAARAVASALDRLGVAELVLVSRHPSRGPEIAVGCELRTVGYEQWTAWAPEAQLIVNTTPLGMAPEVGGSPVRDSDAEHLRGKLVYDIVYRPTQTRLLTQARSAGARTIGGLEMLLHQGSRSFELWTGLPFPVSTVRALLYEDLGT